MNPAGATDTAGVSPDTRPAPATRTGLAVRWIAGHKPESLLGAGVLAAWAGLLHPLHFNWGAESYYSFGWYVVPMAILLGRGRWIQDGRGWTSANPVRQPVVTGLILALLLLQVPFRLAIEINPYWRLPLWGAGLSLIGATWLLVLRIAGWPAARGLAFPILFLATMLPWPTTLERTVIESMSSAVVAANVELLRILGHPVEAQGNVITLGQVAVGVDDACSGIRSLQTLGMLALFVGEFWRLTPVRRLSLVAVAALAALAFNVARALALALCVFLGGREVYAAWHDPAGYISLAGSVGVLLVTAWWLGRRRAGATDVPPQARATRDDAIARVGWTPATTGALLGVSASIAPFLWFTQGGAAAGPHYDIAVHWPDTAPYVCTPLAISDAVRQTLGFDYGERLSIRSASARQFEVWHYGFNDGSGSKSLAAYTHSPAICMTANGAELRETHARLNVDLGPFSLPFQHFTFRSAPSAGGRPIQVFWCMWEGVPGDDATPAAGLRSAILDALLSRRRSLERSVILIGIHDETADAARRTVSHLVHRGVTPIVDGQKVSYRD